LPAFRIKSNGKIIGGREITTYGLVEIELIPTTLKELPKGFQYTVFLGVLENMGFGEPQIKQLNRKFCDF
jgi:hypothetical protein